MLDEIIRIAKLAGSELMKLYGKEYTVSIKNNDPKNFITSADSNSEKIILSELSKSFPLIPVLSEETENNNVDFSKDFFVVDPLDGTRQFVDKIDTFTVNIAYCKAGKPNLGVVYLPAQEKIYVAEKNKGAYLIIGNNEMRIHVSDTLSIDLAKIINKERHHLSKGETFFKLLNLQNVNVNAATGLKICIIAQGIADVFINTSPNTSKWDICASQIILEESGGKITLFSGDEVDYTQPSSKITDFFGANQDLHKQLLDFFIDTPSTNQNN